MTRLLLVVLLAIAAPFPALAQTKWKHGLVQAKADAGFFWMALEKGYFKKRGLDVEFIDLRGDKYVIRALLAGELDSAEPSPGVSLNAIEHGADLRFIGSSMPGFPFALYARKDIAGWPDLTGKTFGVSSPGSTPDIAARAMLRRKGVDPDSIKIANAGGSAGRIQALAGGKIDATASSSEFIPYAEKLGIKVMGLAADLIPEYPRFTIVAKADTLRRRREAVVNFLAAYMEGLDYALKHRDETLQLAGKINHQPANDPRLVHMYDEVKTKAYLSTTSEIPRARIDWLQDEMVKIGELKKKIDLDHYVDESFRQDALKLVNVSGR